MRSTDDLKQEFEHSKNLLRTLVDELKVQVHLAGMDAEEAWERLHDEAQRAVRQTGASSRAAVDEVVGKLKEFAASIRERVSGGAEAPREQ